MAAAKKSITEDEAPEEYVQPNWDVSVDDNFGNAAVSVKPFGWVGETAIRTSIEKAHELGQILLDLKESDTDDEESDDSK